MKLPALLTLAALAAISPVSAETAAPPAARLTAISPFEAVFAPLFDHERHDFDLWQVETAPQADFKRGFLNINLSWQNRPADAQPLLRLSRRLDLDVTGYDTLLVTVALPPGTSLKASATDGRRTVSKTLPALPAPRKELAFPLDGLTRLETLTLEVFTDQDRPGTALFKWFGVQNSAGLAAVEKQAASPDTEWRGFLLPESTEPAFEPQLGVVLSRDDVAHLRRVAAGPDGPAFLTNLRAGVDPWRDTFPETAIKDYLNFFDTREIRDRDIGRNLLRSESVAKSIPEGYAESFAVAGLVLRDKHLLRLALRYALSLAATRDWRDSFLADTPGMSYRGVAFPATLASKSIVYALEAGGDLLTPAGQRYLLQRLADGGTGLFQTEDWFRDNPEGFSIYTTNQYAWFARGRIPALLALETVSPRVKPYTELALDGLKENFDRAITEDGGGLEGPMYFTVLPLSGGQAFDAYARARGVPVASLMPERIRRSADYAEAVASTDDSRTFLPIGDAMDFSGLEPLAQLATMMPDSAWVSLFRKSAALVNSPARLPVRALLLERKLPAQGPAFRPFISLPVVGYVSSRRELAGQTVKLFLHGGKARAGHGHEDKGGFILEFAGDTFAADFPVGSYDDPASHSVKLAQAHNLLVPTGTRERPAPQNPLPHDVYPAAQGDATRFHATVDATPGWEPFYEKWHRTWDSPAPDVLVITDDYRLKQGDGVEFLWQTDLPVTVDGQTITLTGRKGTATLAAPPGTTIRLDKSPRPFGKEGERTRIAIVQKGPAGKLEIRVQLRPLP